MTSWTNTSKDATAFTNQTPSPSGLTWNEATFTWDNAEGTWDNPNSPYANQAKSSTTFTNLPQS